MWDIGNITYLTKYYYTLENKKNDGYIYTLCGNDNYRLNIAIL